ncbi:MAG: SulP family inorganic anion transporter [Archangium sp.]
MSTANVTPAPQGVGARLRSFFTIVDARYEDINRANWKTVVYRDLSAGLIVALTAIPMAMGFAMAMGLRPEQGIIAGAVACLVGRTFGGSKYQVYGPTAAYIPIIAGLMHKYGTDNGGTFAQAHGFLVLVSIIAGVVLMLMGLAGLGKYAKLVPPSVVVGFTIGIAVTIAASNFAEALGISVSGGSLRKIIPGVLNNLGLFNAWALFLALLTFALTKIMQRISIFIPAPLIALGVSTGLALTVLSDKGIVLLKDRFGSIPTHFFVFTPPGLPPVTAALVGDIVYYVIAIAFVAGIESLLCSSMADRLAKNKGTPFDPNREFWGQGLVNIITPLINGFPATGALARTATSIKAGAVSPLAGYFKVVLKLGMAWLLASQLEHVPMACIAGILLWVASNMIKVEEIKEVKASGRMNTGVMIFTAVMVPATDFLTGVLAALALHFVLRRFFLPKTQAEVHATQPHATA